MTDREHVERVRYAATFREGDPVLLLDGRLSANGRCFVGAVREGTVLGVTEDRVSVTFKDGKSGNFPADMVQKVGGPNRDATA